MKRQKKCRSTMALCYSFVDRGYSLAIFVGSTLMLMVFLSASTSSAFQQNNPVRYRKLQRRNLLGSSSIRAIQRPGNEVSGNPNGGEETSLDDGFINQGDRDFVREETASSTKRGDRDVGAYDPSERLGRETVNVGDPQLKVEEKEFSVTSILRELAAIQQEGPRKYCILGTRHCSFLHQQIIELLAYALVLSGNHVYTSGAGGTHSATIKGALRAERPELLTVVLPQSQANQPPETQTLLDQVEDVIEMPQNNEMSLDIASRICNSYLLSLTDQLISFAFHESTTVIEATKEAKDLDMLVTVLYLD